MSFLDVFWPTFWATIVSVALAIPAGLFLNRIVGSVEKHARRKETCEALDELLVALRAALEDLGRIPNDIDRLYHLESAALGPGPYAVRARATADNLKVEPFHDPTSKLVGNIQTHPLSGPYRLAHCPRLALAVLPDPVGGG